VVLPVCLVGLVSSPIRLWGGSARRHCGNLRSDRLLGLNTPRPPDSVARLVCHGHVSVPGLGFGPGCDNLSLGSCPFAGAAAARAQKSMETRTTAFPAANVNEVRGLRPWSGPCRLSPSTPAVAAGRPACSGAHRVRPGLGHRGQVFVRLVGYGLPGGRRVLQPHCGISQGWSTFKPLTTKHGRGHCTMR
jgi:hypothetical protein